MYHWHCSVAGPDKQTRWATTRGSQTMEGPGGDHSLGTGLYYAENDYIGLGKRLLIWAADSCVLAAALGITNLLWHSLPANDTLYKVLSLGFLVFAYFYLTVIKVSRIRTLGYRLLGAKVVTFRGERPSLFRMTLRLVLWVLFSFRDIIWVGIDQDRQSLRDRFAGTCVVKDDAISMGQAPIHLAYYQAFCYSLMLPTVCRPRSV